MRNELFDKEVNSCVVLEAKIVGNLDHFLCRDSSFYIYAEQNVPQGDGKFYELHLNCGFEIISLDLMLSGRLKEEITEVQRNCFSKVGKLMRSLDILPMCFTRGSSWLLILPVLGNHEHIAIPNSYKVNCQAIANVLSVGIEVWLMSSFK